jgi:hypothetical protein
MASCGGLATRLFAFCAAGQGPIVNWPQVAILACISGKPQTGLALLGAL